MFKVDCLALFGMNVMTMETKQQMNEFRYKVHHDARAFRADIKAFLDPAPQAREGS